MPVRSTFARIFGRDVLTDASRVLFDEVIEQLSIADALTSLDDDWVVFNAVPVSTRESDIDHLVIGPGGIFALTVAHHSDQSVWVARGAFQAAGSRHNHIRNSEFEVGCVERLLGAALGQTVTATGVVVVVEPRSVVIREEPRDVAVIPSRDLVAWLERRPASLSADAVDALSAAASAPATWLQRDACIDSGAELHERFREVVRTDREAARIRRLWILSTITLIVAAFSLWAWALVMLEST